MKVEGSCLNGCAVHAQNDWGSPLRRSLRSTASTPGGSPKAEWTANSGGIRHGVARSAAASRRKPHAPVRARPQVFRPSRTSSHAPSSQEAAQITRTLSGMHCGNNELFGNAMAQLSCPQMVLCGVLDSFVPAAVASGTKDQLAAQPPATVSKHK